MLLTAHAERFYPDLQMIRSNEIKYRKKQNFVSFPLTSIKLGRLKHFLMKAYNFNVGTGIRTQHLMLRNAVAFEGCSGSMVAQQLRDQIRHLSSLQGHVSSLLGSQQG